LHLFRGGISSYKATEFGSFSLNNAASSELLLASQVATIAQAEQGDGR
jgi:hypothetical protein